MGRRGRRGKRRMIGKRDWEVEGERGGKRRREKR